MAKADSKTQTVLDLPLVQVAFGPGANDYAAANEGVVAYSNLDDITGGVNVQLLPGFESIPGWFEVREKLSASGIDSTLVYPEK